MAMLNLRALLVPLLALLPVVSGCGGYDCNDGCSDGKSCANSTTKNLDCGSFCDGIKKLNDEADCANKWDDYTKCVGDQKDKCSVLTGDSMACDSELSAYGLCIAPYCSDAAHTAECTSDESGLGG
jgi:hypothetical protein